MSRLTQRGHRPRRGRLHQQALSRVRGAAADSQRAQGTRGRGRSGEPPRFVRAGHDRPAHAHGHGPAAHDQPGLRVHSSGALRPPDDLHGRASRQLRGDRRGHGARRGRRGVGVDGEAFARASVGSITCSGRISTSSSCCYPRPTKLARPWFSRASKSGSRTARSGAARSSPSRSSGWAPRARRAPARRTERGCSAPRSHERSGLRDGAGAGIRIPIPRPRPSRIRIPRPSRRPSPRRVSRHAWGRAGSRVGAPVARGPSHRTVQVLFTYGSSGQRAARRPTAAPTACGSAAAIARTPAPPPTPACAIRPSRCAPT